MGLFGFGKKKQEEARRLAQENYESGMKCYDRKDYYYAKHFFMPAAENGHAGAQFMMGEMTWNGWGMEEDNEKAAYWYAEAAKQGHAAAQYMRGFLYYLGSGVKEDYGEAIRWFELAVKGGNVEAAYKLGEFYEVGRGCTKDMDKAIEYWKIAAEQNHEPSLVCLGEAYRDRGEKEEAIKWFRLAEKEHGNSYASRQIEEMDELSEAYKACVAKREAETKREEEAKEDPYGAYQKGLAYAEEENDEESHEWIEAAARHGCADAQFDLAHWDHREMVQDFEELRMIAYWMKIAAENGHAQAMYEYAWMLATGYGLEQDLDEAEKWAKAGIGYGAKQDLDEAEKWAKAAVDAGCSEAAELMLSAKCAQVYANYREMASDFETAYRFYYIDAVKGDAYAQYKVGKYYLEGKGVSEDADKAIKWLKKAADQDYDPAQNKLAYYYLDKYSYWEAKIHFRILAEKGDAAAMNNLAFIYEREGTPTEREEIMELLERAAEKGNEVAMYNLAKAYLAQYNKGDAKKWALAAKEAGHKEAEALLKRI